jgi:hypothetical protein
MIRPAQIVLPAMAVVLGFGGLAILLSGLAFAVFGLAWSNHSARDLVLVAAILLYAVPAGIGMLYGATWAASSASAGSYEATTRQSRRTIGVILTLPLLATVVVLGLAFPDYRFWPGTSTQGVLTVLLALLLAFVGGWLATRTDVESVA